MAFAMKFVALLALLVSCSAQQARLLVQKVNTIFEPFIMFLHVYIFISEFARFNNDYWNESHSNVCADQQWRSVSHVRVNLHVRVAKTMHREATGILIEDKFDASAFAPLAGACPEGVLAHTIAEIQPYVNNESTISAIFYSLLT